MYAKELGEYLTLVNPHDLHLLFLGDEHLEDALFVEGCADFLRVDGARKGDAPAEFSPETFLEVILVFRDIV